MHFLRVGSFEKLAQAGNGTRTANRSSHCKDGSVRRRMRSIESHFSLWNPSCNVPHMPIKCISMNRDKWEMRFTRNRTRYPRRGVSQGYKERSVSEDTASHSVFASRTNFHAPRLFGQPTLQLRAYLGLVECRPSQSLGPNWVRNVCGSSWRTKNTNETALLRLRGIGSTRHTSVDVCSHRPCQSSLHCP